MNKRKIFPALALIGGVYLLLNKKNTPSSSQQDDTYTPPPPIYIPEGDLEVYTETSLSGFNDIDYNTWRGSDWYNYINNLSIELGKKNAIIEAYKHWKNKENRFSSIFPTIESFMIGLATIEGKKKQISGLVNWDSQPVYDTEWNWWYGIEAWSCTDWKNWHIELESHYNSTAKANQVWEAAWDSPQNKCNFLGIMFCPDTDYCRYDCDWVKYFASKGVTNLNSLMSGVYCDLSNVVLNITGAASDVSQGVANTSNLLKWAIPVGAIAGGYFVYKKYVK